MRSRSRSPRSMHRVSNSRKSWSRYPRKNTYRMPKSERSRSPRNIPDRLLKPKWSRSPAVRSIFLFSRDQSTYSRNTSTPNVTTSSGKNVPSASTLNRHFPMEEGRKWILMKLSKSVIENNWSSKLNFLENSSPRKIKFRSYFVMVIYSKTKFCQNVFPQGNFVLAFHKF